MSEKAFEQLTALGAHLEGRRGAILRAWHEASLADPTITTANSLTRAQFNDHIPQLLDAFVRKLKARPGSNREAVAERQQTQEEVKHGLQRWQQGYDLRELMHEWGHLHFCLFNEIAAFESEFGMDRDVLTVAHRELIGLVNEGISESAAQYARMQKAEAAGHVRDLQSAITNLSEIDRRRVELIRQALHDLRGSVQSVVTAADILREEGILESERVEFAKLVQSGVESLSDTLGELMTLARLEAGLELREIAPFDAASLLAELCRGSQLVASQRTLGLQWEGPEVMNVEGDAGKVRRIVQNLLFNALKYTEQGGVRVSWGQETESWWVMVDDSGPGLMGGPGAPIAAGMQDATDAARESDVAGGTLSPAPGGVVPGRRNAQQAGEGIGLSIVKRLCELLDARVELASSAETGTTFRIVFPRAYSELRHAADAQA